MRVTASCAIALCCLSNNLRSQSLDSVMNRYFSKIGGKETVASINSSKEVSFNWFRKNKEEDPEKTKPIKTLTFIKEPCYRKFISYDSKGEIENEFFYNEKGYVLGLGGVIQKSKEKVNFSVSTATDLFESFSKGTLKYVGEKKISGQDYDVVSKSTGKTIQYFYFNKTTGLLDASQMKEWPNRITFYKEYKKSGSIMHPFLTESYDGGIIFYKRIIESCEFNPILDANTFLFDERQYEEDIAPKVKYESTRLESAGVDFETFVQSNFADKRVFVDLWATWCAPCKKEFRSYDSAYYAFMEKNNIKLLYLSIDKDSYAKSWEKDVNRLGLMGYHVRADKKLMQSIQTVVYNDSTVVIPRYLLIDEHGKILSKHFTRPSSPSFNEDIFRLLKR